MCTLSDNELWDPARAAASGTTSKRPARLSRSRLNVPFGMGGLAERVTLLSRPTKSSGRARGIQFVYIEMAYRRVIMLPGLTGGV
ncbi:MAG: hypothetical protein ACE5GU_13535 [Candidatus Scalinduaceae bacterium]